MTNNAVQKYSKNYGKFEEGNIVTMEELFRELAESYQTPEPVPKLKQQIESQIEEQIIMSLEAVKAKLKFSKYTFELVGYDFMLIQGANNQQTSADNPQEEGQPTPCQTAF